MSETLAFAPNFLAFGLWQIVWATAEFAQGEMLTKRPPSPHL